MGWIRLTKDLDVTFYSQVEQTHHFRSIDQPISLQVTAEGGVKLEFFFCVTEMSEQSFHYMFPALKDCFLLSCDP